MHNGNVQDISIESVIFDEAYYPRQQFDQETVNRYRQALDKLPPIEITHEGLLIDGYHRLIAHRIEQKPTIQATIETLDQSLVLWESVKRNARHGFQLGQKDKQKLGRRFYADGKEVADIAEVLSVTERAVSNWTQDLRLAEKEERDSKIWEMWLACKSDDEIAQEVQLTDRQVRNIISEKKESFPKFPPDSLQVYNLWNFHSNDDRYGMDYPGRIPGQIVENMLYYYTKPFDVVVDTFGGGGTTLDVCKAMSRRYRVYDLKPVRDDIKQHDITTGFPTETKGCNLIFLDPPYWSQKQGEYSADGTNLANLPLDEFYQALDCLFENAAERLVMGGYIALIIGPSQEKGIIYDHALKIAKLLEKRFTFTNRIIVPYTTQQAKPYHVSDAKENGYMLKLYRDLLVYQKWMDSLTGLVDTITRPYP